MPVKCIRHQHLGQCGQRSPARCPLGLEKPREFNALSIEKCDRAVSSRLPASSQDCTRLHRILGTRAQSCCTKYQDPLSHWSMKTNNNGKIPLAVESGGTASTVNTLPCNDEAATARKSFPLSLQIQLLQRMDCSIQKGEQASDTFCNFPRPSGCQRHTFRLRCLLDR